ncbi:type VI secretion system Vgr family protein [Pontibacter toksunensis]|uniref:Type VI secretion system Vgr family protein n=1 Tax=Pontibacter toksunensis TaxID=1332631 RepID=A0ABW6BSS0_9BACT
MAQFVVTGIDIEGKSIKQFSSLTLSQGIAEHHSFRLVCPTEAIDGTKGTIFHASKNMVGASITIQIAAVGSPGTLQFAGLVTQVEAARFSGHTGDIIISGYSPTILMDDGPHCKTWEEKGIKDIAQDVLQPFPQNLLQPQLNPVYAEKIFYTAQYKETAWQFLKRLSATYGEWLYYNGEKLVLGSEKGKSISLVYGNNLSHFNMALQVKPASFQMLAYDYMNHEVYNGSPSSIAAKAGLNDLGKHALQKSESFYAAQPKQWYNQFLTSKKQLDDYANTRAAMQSSNMVRINGNSSHPGIQVGATICVGGKNVFSQADESFGEYTVLSVSHCCDGQGNYSNDFIAIPATIKMPPQNNCPEPYCETQSAMVTDNHDEKGLGRIRVKFHWMEGSEKSPWLRVTTPHAGGGKGMFLMPEVGEEVIVGFEGDSPTKPYVIGSVYHGKAKCSFGNGGNDVKALQSKSGNKVLMNDKDGSVQVSDSKGNDVMVDGNGNINITSSASIKLTCGSSSMELKSDGTITINGKGVSISGTESITATGGQNATIGSGGASFAADGTKNEANMGGMKANINGGAEANMNGGAKTTVSAGGKVAIQGAIVALN